MGKLTSVLLVIYCSLFCFPGGAATATPTSVREADAVCEGCHHSIFEGYLETPMANASGPATSRLLPGRFLHAPSGIDYRISIEDGVAWLSYKKLSGEDVQGREQLDYFLGSGHLGLTYLYSKKGYLLESPVAYYPNLKTYDMKPGLENISHLPEALTVDSNCLRCHMSGVQPVDAGTEDHYSGLPFLHTGITCESCHGDTQRHVLTKGTAAVINPLKLEPEERDSTCIVCHLEGATNVERPGRSILRYQPGEKIIDYLTYFAFQNESTTERGVSEIEQFTSSRCKQRTGASMSCMNCHDPHRSPKAAERTAYYRSKCLACHSESKIATDHYPDQPDCTSCHMPKRGANNIPHVAWTDHRILQRPNQAVILNLDTDQGGQLTPILGGKWDARDLALGYYDLAVKGDLREKKRAAALLSAAAQIHPDDPALLQAMGIMAEWDGESSRAEDIYKSVLKIDPLSLTSATNLGTLLAKSGHLQAAASLWQPVFERNEDVLTLGQNLATIECLLGEKDPAVKTLERVLLYNPDVSRVRENLEAIQSGERLCSSNTGR